MDDKSPPPGDLPVIFVLCADWGYDGQTLAGAYSSETLATEAAAMLDLRDGGRPVVYEVALDGPADERTVPRWDSDALVIQRYRRPQNAPTTEDQG